MKFLVVQLFLGISFSFTYSQAIGQIPFVLGIVDEFHSVILSENRILNIYLPPEYDSKDSTRYSVIYLLDGSADEDFIHVSGLVQFNTFPWVNRIPKSIVVGIANVDRRRDFTIPTSVLDDQEKYPTAGHSDRFIQFIEKELQPYINSKYKTNASKTIIGESLGGLLATEILLKRPSLFDHYIIISPSLWWNNGSLLNHTGEILEAKYSHPTVIYIGVGKEGLTPSDPPRVMEVDANLLAEKLKNSKSKSVQVYFDYLPEENHATVGHQSIYNAFRMIYPAGSN
jgi:predicted alpha/beta superfamily hydrolase